MNKKFHVKVLFYILAVGIIMASFAIPFANAQASSNQEVCIAWPTNSNVVSLQPLSAGRTYTYRLQHTSLWWIERAPVSVTLSQNFPTHDPRQGIVVWSGQMTAGQIVQGSFRANSAVPLVLVVQGLGKNKFRVCISALVQP